MGKLRMVTNEEGKRVPFFAADGKGKMAKGGIASGYDIIDERRRGNTKSRKELMEAKKKKEAKEKKLNKEFEDRRKIAIKQNKEMREKKLNEEFEKKRKIAIKQNKEMREKKDEKKLSADQIKPITKDKKINKDTNKNLDSQKKEREEALNKQALERVDFFNPAAKLAAAKALGKFGIKKFIDFFKGRKLNKLTRKEIESIVNNNKTLKKNINLLGSGIKKVV